MNILYKSVANKIIVQLSDNLISENVDDFKKSVFEVIEKDSKSIIFDFERIEYVSVDFLKVFLSICRKLKSKSLLLIIIRINSTLKSIIQDLGLNDIFVLSDGLSNAIKIENVDVDLKEKETQSTDLQKDVFVEEKNAESSGHEPINRKRKSFFNKLFSKK